MALSSSEILVMHQTMELMKVFMQLHHCALSHESLTLAVYSILPRCVASCIFDFITQCCLNSKVCAAPCNPLRAAACYVTCYWTMLAGAARPYTHLGVHVHDALNIFCCNILLMHCCPTMYMKVLTQLSCIHELSHCWYAQHKMTVFGLHG